MDTESDWTKHNLDNTPAKCIHINAKYFIKMQKKHIHLFLYLYLYYKYILYYYLFNMYIKYVDINIYFIFI